MKHFNQVRKFGSMVKLAVVGGVASLVSVSAMAAPSTDWSTLTDAIDFGTLATGLLGAGAALIGVYLTIKGVKIIIGMAKGG